MSSLEIDLTALTTWINDTKHTAKFRLLTDKQKGRKNTGVVSGEVVIKPGESKQLASEYDRAIRTEDANGIVVGGLCPWLKKKGEDEVNLHPSLNFEAVKEELELDELAKELEKTNAMKEAIKVMAEKKASAKASKKDA